MMTVGLFAYPLAAGSIHDAIDNSDLVIVAKLLIGNKALLHSKSEYGNSPLHGAAVSGNLEIAQLLVAVGANLNFKGVLGKTPLSFAVTRGSDEIVELFIKHGANVNVKDTAHGTPLHLAAFSGNSRIIKMLLKAGADTKIFDPAGKTALQIAQEKFKVTLSEKFSSTISLLQGKEALPTSTIATHSSSMITSTQTQTLSEDLYAIHIHFSAQRGNIDQLRCLVAEGGNIDGFHQEVMDNPATAEKYSPLHTAVKFGQYKATQFLLSKGADIGFKNSKTTYQPIHVAVQYGRLEILKLLMSKGASIDAAGEYGYAPLHLAVKFNRHKIVQLLIDKGANVNGMDENEYTPLHTAIDYNVIEMVKLLLKNKARIDLKVGGTDPVQEYAKEMECNEIYELLVKHAKS